MLLNFDIISSDTFGIGTFMKDLRKYLSQKEKTTRLLVRMPDELHRDLLEAKKKIRAKSMNETILAACRLFTEAAKKQSQ